MKKRFLFIPLDNRPCTFKMPVALGKAAGFELIHPPPDLLGNFNEPGNSDDILLWIEKTSEVFDAAILEMDMLIYGGLVASRKPDLPLDLALKRFDRIREVISRKKENLGKIYVFNSLLRTAPTYTDESIFPLAEKIIEFSREKFYQKMGEHGASRRLQKLKNEIPTEILQDYLEVRARNFEINKRILNLADEEISDFTLIGMDDSAREGMNFLERDELKQKIDQLKLETRVMIGPGTDESSMILFCRALSDLTGIYPTIYPVYSNSAGKKVIPRYEDRSFSEIISFHVKASGAQLSLDRPSAEILLYAHVPPDRQEESSTQKFRFSFKRNTRKFAISLGNNLKRGRRVALADLFYANGADLALMKLLETNVNVLDLWGFAAWNTAGNTIGTVISQAVTRFITEKITTDPDEKKTLLKHQINLLLERFVDDWLYQSKTRQEARRDAIIEKASILNLGDKTDRFRDKVAESLKIKVENFYDSFIAGKKVHLDDDEQLEIENLKLTEVKLPWNRLFEVDFTIDFSITSV